MAITKPSSNMLVFSKSAKSATFTALLSDDSLSCDATGGAITANLYTAVGNAGRQLTFFKSDSSANLVTLDAFGSETIGGALTLKMGTQYDYVTIESNNVGWDIINYGVNTSAKYYGTAFSGTTGIVILTTKVTDPLSAYNVSTGVYTVGVAGLYDISGMLQTAGTAFAVNGYFQVYASLNASGSSVQNLLGGSRAETTSAVNRYASGATIVRAAAGDTISLYQDSSASTAPVSAVMSIKRIGN